MKTKNIKNMQNLEIIWTRFVCLFVCLPNLRRLFNTFQDGWSSLCKESHWFFRCVEISTIVKECWYDCACWLFSKNEVEKFCSLGNGLWRLTGSAFSTHTMNHCYILRVCFEPTVNRVHNFKQQIQRRAMMIGKWCWHYLVIELFIIISSICQTALRLHEKKAVH